jgi:hypothetical protein
LRLQPELLGSPSVRAKILDRDCDVDETAYEGHTVTSDLEEGGAHPWAFGGYRI